MRRSTPIRLFSILLVVGSLAAIPLAGPVSAAATPPTTCLNPKSTSDPKKFTATSTLTACSNKAATGGSGVAVINFKVLTKITGKITWKGTGTTTFQITEKAVKPNKCKAPSVEIISTGKVTGGTGAALKLIPKGSPYSETVCAVTSGKDLGKTTLFPGTKVII